ncbi:MAG: MBL fold metallo-hydrolase [Desulfuromonadales bacterium]|nr:MBL fold metallo-hydrolase [Desulfuromonadales bacterium]NIR33124.1 MBL fold metallo-hydrolase [Desulfuromonadales bacterium]NIS39362.1 MBL fold metallo-hydrolase [Desulfuromonadales bacterium]
MRVCVLASGSQGNALYIESDESRILIDAGLSGRELARRLALIGVEADDLDAIFVTHEHQDHCRGLGAMARRHHLPVFAHEATLKALPRLGRVSDIREFDVGDHVDFRDIQVRSFPVTHDAASPVGFTIETTAGKIGMATDLGIPTRLVADRLRECRVLVIESNHDEKMLRDGPYPWHLKERIRSTHGHLSNGASAGLLDQLAWPGLDMVFLAHLSEQNNCPDLAGQTAREVVDAGNLCRPRIEVAGQHQVSTCFRFT